MNERSWLDIIQGECTQRDPVGIIYAAYLGNTARFVDVQFP